MALFFLQALVQSAAQAQVAQPATDAAAASEASATESASAAADVAASESTDAAAAASESAEPGEGRAACARSRLRGLADEAWGGGSDSERLAGPSPASQALASAARPRCAASPGVAARAAIRSQPRLLSR